MSAPLPVAVLGGGLVGSRHAKAVEDCPLTQLTAVAEPDPGIRDRLAAQGYPGVEIVAFIGDNRHDRPQPISADDKFFCIDQGGMYGTPCAQRPQPVMN